MNINDLFEKMVAEDGSDMYVLVGAPPILSAKGKLKPLNKIRMGPADTRQFAYSFMNDVQKKEFEEVHEMNLAHSIPKLGRFRLNIYKQKGSVGVVARRIKLEIMSLEDLKLPEILKTISMADRGLVLVTGATGSGKSTTLAAMIDARNSSKSGHIVTIEDPLEFIHNHKKSVISQREVGMDTQTYKNALKSALRQAPNVMLIGEIRDQETMEAAISFAETGHLVFSTLHSNNANQTMERIMNFFPTESHPMLQMQLSLNLNAVICQRLMRTKDGKGRAAALEILLNSPRVSDLIHKGETEMLKTVMAGSTLEGMQTFDQALYNLFKEDKITYETAIAAADSANDLKLKIKMESAEKISTEGIGFVSHGDILD